MKYFTIIATSFIVLGCSCLYAVEIPPPPPHPDVLIVYDKEATVIGFQIYDVDDQEYVFLPLTNEEILEIKRCKEKQFNMKEYVKLKPNDRLKVLEEYSRRSKEEQIVPCSKRIEELKVKEYKLFKKSRM